MADGVAGEPEAVGVLLERGRTWTFAAAVEWPGWCRRAKGGDEAALAMLQHYEQRYRSVVQPAGVTFRPGPLEVVEAVPGNATTDFGAPDARSDDDRRPLVGAEAARLADLLDACWAAFDAVVASAPALLRKGPRGGGRDRDPIAAHVQESERSYTRSIGVRVPPRTSWPEQRGAILGAVRGRPEETPWPVRYYVRRTAWHVMDHAWEIEDRSP
jgi:hypothetical protein